MNQAQEVANQAKQLQSWRATTDKDLFAAWDSPLTPENVSTFDQAVDRRGNLNPGNPSNYWRFMHEEVDTPQLLETEQRLVATYKHWQLLAAGAAGGAAAAWRWARHRPNLAIGVGFGALVVATAAEEVNTWLVRTDPAYSREQAHRRDRYRLRMYVWDLDRRKIVFPLRCVSTVLAGAAVAGIMIGLSRRPTMPWPRWISSAKGAADPTTTGLPRALPQRNALPWGGFPPPGTLVQEGGNASMVRVGQLVEAAVEGWRAETGAGAADLPPPKEFYFALRRTYDALVEDVYGGATQAPGRTPLEDIAPGADLSWMEGVLDDEEEEGEEGGASIAEQVEAWEAEYQLHAGSTTSAEPR